MLHLVRAHARPRHLRRIISTAGLVATLALVSACGSSAGHAGASSDATPGSAPSISGGAELGGVIPAGIADMALQNQDGKTVHLADFKGKNVVIQDGMTLCQEQCPIDTATFVAMARQYASSAADPANTVFLTITVDPVRDIPAQLAAYRSLYAPGHDELPQWQLLTGSQQDITALWKYFHVYWEKVPQDAVVKNWRTGVPLTYDIQHSDEVFFIDKSLQQRYLLDGMPSLGGAIPTKIKAFMTAEGMANMKMSNWTVAQGLSVLKWVNGL